MKQYVLYTVLSLLIIGGIGAGAYFVNQAQDEELPESIPVDRPLSAYIPGQNAAGSGSLEVQSADTTPSQNSGNGLPQPSEFGQYEEYRNNEAALFIDVVEGEGEAVQQNDSVAVIYRGWLTTGQLFDESRVNEEGLLEPFVFQLGSGSVIPGWEQTILGMKIGGERRLIIPPSLGYGEIGRDSIPPNAMLIFDVELVAREPQQSP